MANDGAVLLVGSIPLADTETVFETLGRHLGETASRYPDGETGERTNWVSWQVHAFSAHPSFERVSIATPLGRMDRFELKLGVDDALSFGPLGYARVALRSWVTFRNLRAAGAIPTGTRFQVSLPTPVAIAATFSVQGTVPAVTAALSRRMEAELAEIAAGIPHSDLAVQWDCAIEPIVMAGGLPDAIGGMREHFLTSLPAFIDLVPEGIQVGVHLCYGDPGHKHIVEPVDLALCVDLANALTARTRRRIDWIHMPVPRDRGDDAYVAPLNNLSLRSATRLYLGLVHFTDGVDGARRRIAMARAHRADFGIATECGFGRRDPATVPELLDIHIAALT